MDEDFQVMLSYRITEAGAMELGGDGTVPRMKDWLNEQGFSVFVGESSLQGGQDWARTIQNAVEKCEVFVAICSPDYGNTTWTYRELSMADNKKNAQIVPVWHSGVFPPSHVEIILGATQRVPSGHKSLVQLSNGEWEQAMRQLVAAFRSRGCVPKHETGMPQKALCVDNEYVPLWPNGDRVVERSDDSGSPKHHSPKLLSAASAPAVLSWGLLTSMTPPLRSFLEQEGLRLEVAVQLADEWGVSTIDDLALIEEEDISALGLKIIDMKRLKAVLAKARNPHVDVAPSTPHLPSSQSSPSMGMSRPPSAGLQRKYLQPGVRQSKTPVANVKDISAQRRTSSCATSPASYRTIPADPPAPNTVTGAAGKMRRLSMAPSSPSPSPATALSAVPRRLNEAPPRRTSSSDYGGPVNDLSSVLIAKRVTAVVERFTLKGHTGTIASLAFSADGGMLASGGSQYDRSIRVWSVQHGELRAELIGHGSAVLSVPFSPDGRLVASASKDKTVKVWDVSAVMGGGRTGGYCEKMSAVATLSGHAAEVTGTAFTYDGKQVVSSSLDRNIKIWDTTTWVCTSTLTGHTRGVTAIAASHTDARMAVSGCADGTVRVWDLRNGRCNRTLVGVHAGTGVQSVSLTSDGLQLLTACPDDRTVRIYDMRATGPSDARKLQGHSEGVTCVCAMPAQGCAATSGHDKSVRIWDLAGASCINVVPAHTAAASCVAAVTDGATLATVASGSNDETIKINVFGLATA